ncbi:MAG: hypothetical protein A2Y62_16880 [Candidatus Fischerbacteria bacterium RBG_13_37_8]|uniref:non-specific serine/threonine protein kinase n=1 Tax=Candidatus Fischerbacteria bacterium RBG_13_37_8 TaxID=1817863 RepID=A0A1F5VEA5_9BACT|nr:MAG: hypothetical protein A2Y62_16880 [Candidatus Fischerbacteria bacterium RBG_13_37_8]
MKCTKCGQDNIDGSRYCNSCGSSLTGSSEDANVFPTIEVKPITGLDLSKGQDFGKRYKIIGEIGRGGMGFVFKALDKELNQVVALKIIRPELSSEPRIVERFKRELILAREITHENVIRIHDIGEEENVKYLSMSYIEGRNLKEYLSTSETIEIENFYNIIEQVSNALIAAHAKGVIHRDLKPSNIMIDQNGHVYVMDFGIAKSIETISITQDGSMIGTPEYMSPEQAQGMKVDNRSDIYSLGIIMYEMLTGKPPFQADTLMGLAHKHINERPILPTKIRSHIPKALEDCILKCLQKKPQDRYKTAQELLDDIQKIPAGKFKKPFMRRWKIALLSLCGIIIILALAPSYLSRIGKQKIDASSKQPKIADDKGIGMPSKTQWKNSIAVLPFKNSSPDKNQEYLCEGITEQIITNLTHIKDLKVIAQTSVMKYQNTTKDMRMIGKELGVAHILEGSVQKSSARIRVTAKLIQVADGFYMWSDVYDKELKDVFALQDEVSQAIAESLKVTFSGNAKKIIDTKRPRNVDAFEYYLKAKHIAYNQFLVSNKQGDFEKALEYANKAIVIDPDYAIGYAVFVNLYELHYILDGDEKDIELMLKYAEKAYQLNPDIPETSIALGWALSRKNEYDRAFPYFKKALELNPNNSDTNDWFGDFTVQLGLYDQAFDFYQKALELNPLHVSSYIYRGFAYLQTGEPRKAIADFQKLLEIQPENSFGLSGLARAYILLKDFKAADIFLSKAEKLKSTDSVASSNRSLYFAAQGMRKEALSLHPDATVYAQLHMNNEAIKLIQESINKSPDTYSYLSLLHNPLYDNLRNDPSFQAIIELQKKKYNENQKKYSLN